MLMSYLLFKDQNPFIYLILFMTFIFMRYTEPPTVVTMKYWWLHSICSILFTLATVKYV